MIPALVSTFAVHGNWLHASSPANTDPEAQTITGTHAPFELPIAAEPAGVAAALTRAPIPPPPYADAELPAYSADLNDEPTTLAMYLFKFGFLFPPFWIIGAVILLSPLTAPVDFEPSKSGTEREQHVQIIRNAELRWAKRCAWALLVLLILASFITAIVLVVLYT